MGTNLPIVNSFLGLFVSIGLRLKEERERLDLNQTDFAKIGGVGRKSQFNYEENERSPDAEYLAAIAAEGADIQYIVTGIRKGTGFGESAVHQAVLNAIEFLSLEKKVDGQQLANAVVKIAVRNSEWAKLARPPLKKQEQNFHGDVGQVVKVDGDMNQPGVTFSVGGKKKK